MNMAELLIPKFESDKPNNITINLIKQEDQRLHRRLSIAEFITAFGKYKRVMCQRYPERRVQLDRYEAIKSISITYMVANSMTTIVNFLQELQPPSETM